MAAKVNPIEARITRISNQTRIFASEFIVPGNEFIIEVTTKCSFFEIENKVKLMPMPDFDPIYF